MTSSKEARTATPAAMKVPLLDLRAQYATIRDDVKEAVDKVFESQQFILGAQVEEFERDASVYCRSRYAVGCASGSDALLLALMALGIGEGDEVIVPSFTFFATGSSVARLGAKPVYVDITAQDYNLNPDLIADAITSKTRAIMPVHLFGQCADMDRVLDIARKNNLPVIEDAAQAIGADYHGQRAGTMGVIGCFSFFPSKNLGGAGDGGLMTTEDADIAQKLRIMRVHGMEPKYYHHFMGINSRLDALQAAVLRVKLKHLDKWTEGRRRNAARYDALFDEAGITDIVPPVAHTGMRHIYNQYTIRAPRRDELLSHLKTEGIGAEVYYPVPLHLQECFSYLGYHEGSLPVTEEVCKEVLSLPIYPELTEDMQRYVAETISGFYHQ